MSDCCDPTWKTYAECVLQHKGKIADKWSSYLPIYNQLFTHSREEPLSILEIGVQNGGSLECYASYFQNAKFIIGCDIDKACERLTFQEANIHLIVGDANAHETRTRILNICDAFDFIIDDGSHTSSDIITSFSTYFPHLKLGGSYIIEDLHCSYWRSFEGGLYGERSSLSFLKLLADVINSEHWGINKTRSQFIEETFPGILPDGAESWLETIYSIQFFNSVCVIQKAAPEIVGLGRRVISGSVEAVTENAKQHDATPPIHIAQDDNPLSHFHAWRREFAILEERLEKKEAEFALRSLDSQKAEESKLQSIKVEYDGRLAMMEAEFTSIYNDLKNELSNKERLIFCICHHAMAMRLARPSRWKTLLIRFGLRRMFPFSYLDLQNDVDLIQSSGHFDPVYYVTEHPEALECGNPLAHYLTIGWRKGYKPNRSFDTDAVPLSVNDRAPLLNLLRTKAGQE